MNKNVMNVAVAILLSLGVTACGSKHNETIVSTQPNTSAAEVAAAKAEAETAKAAAETAQAEAETAKAAAETAQAEVAAAQAAQAAAEAKVTAAQAAQAVAERDAEAAKLAATNAALAQAEAEKAAADAQTQAAQAEKALTEAQTALTEAQAVSAEEIAQLKAELAAAQANVDAANAAVAAAEAKASEAAAATVAAEVATKAAQAETAVAKAAAQAAQAEAENQKAAAEKAVAEKATAEKELAAAKAELSQAEQELVEAKAATAKAEEEAATAKAEAETAKAEAETAKTEAETAKAAAEAAQQEADEANAKLAAIAAQEKTDANRIANSLNTRYFAGNASSQTYQYVNDETKKAELLTAIENRSGSCDAKYTAACTRDAKAATAGSINEGDVLFTQNLSYAGYAVVREAYDADNVQSQPVNSYIAVVKTPTTDKSKVVNATYTGTATLTQKNQQTMVGAPNQNDKIATLTLNVKDDVVSGDITRNTGKTPATYVTFNDTTIKAGDNGVVFEGNATFNSQTNALTTQKDASGNWIDVNGSYRGAFAGANAEEVVGTFETDNTSKEVSIQGAFSGTKAE